MNKTYLKSDYFFNPTEHEGEAGLFILPHTDDDTFYFISGLYHTIFLAIANGQEESLKLVEISQLNKVIQDLLKVELLGLTPDPKFKLTDSLKFKKAELEKRLGQTELGQLKAINFMMSPDLNEKFTLNGEKISIYAQACCSSSGATRGA